MKALVLIASALMIGGPAAAADGVVATPIDSTTKTWTGQPLTLPQGPVEVISQTVVIPSGGALPVHKHPYPRFAYVLSGRLEVINDDAHVSKVFEPGAFVVEAIDQWHHAVVVGDQPVRLLVIDDVPPGAGNVVMRPAP